MSRGGTCHRLGRYYICRPIAWMCGLELRSIYVVFFMEEEKTLCLGEMSRAFLSRCGSCPDTLLR